MYYRSLSSKKACPLQLLAPAPQMTDSADDDPTPDCSPDTMQKRERLVFQAPVFDRKGKGTDISGMIFTDDGDIPLASRVHFGDG